MAGLTSVFTSVSTHIAVGWEGGVARVRPGDGAGHTVWGTLQGCRLSLSYRHVHREGKEVGGWGREGGWGWGDIYSLVKTSIIDDLS